MKKLKPFKALKDSILYLKFAGVVTPWVIFWIGVDGHPAAAVGLT
jgi:hypothetical protein